MPPTLFTNIGSTLQGLISQIQFGQIGFPDQQRPFVWPNIKVRDLFDSRYRGYPAGYLFLWQNGGAGPTHGIGTGRKQGPEQMLVADGQQRLTSPRSVFRRGQPC